jgi:formate dehydrogenase major subunit
VHIQEVKAFACDVQPGRRPRGPNRIALVKDYQRRAGITKDTGMEM